MQPVSWTEWVDNASAGHQHLAKERDDAKALAREVAGLLERRLTDYGDTNEYEAKISAFLAGHKERLE